MGLIKTAMMTGGGIYAVKQLAKTAERRQDSRSNKHNNYQDPRGGGYSDQYWRPQGPPPPPRPYEDQREWPTYNQSNDNRYPTYGPNGGQQRFYSDEDYRSQQREAGQPPSYYPDQQELQQRQQQVYSMESRDRGRDDSRGGPSGFGGMVMEFASRGDGKNGKMLDKGTQMVSEFFGK